MTNMGGPQMWNMRALLDMIAPEPDDNETHETAQQQAGFGRERRSAVAYMRWVVVGVHLVAAAIVYLALWG